MPYWELLFYFPISVGAVTSLAKTGQKPRYSITRVGLSHSSELLLLNKEMHFCKG